MKLLNCVQLFGNNAVFTENFGFVLHTVLLRKHADDPARHACRKGIGRDVFCNDTAGTDDNTVSDRDPGADRDVGTEPAIIADGHGFCIAETSDIAVFVEHGFAFIGEHRVQRCNNGHIRSEVAIVPDFYGCIVLHGEIEIDEGAFADGCVLRVTDIIRTRPKTAIFKSFRRFTLERRQPSCGFNPKNPIKIPRLRVEDFLQ